jgi:hypothetical protein
VQVGGTGRPGAAGGRRGGRAGCGSSNKMLTEGVPLNGHANGHGVPGNGQIPDIRTTGDEAASRVGGPSGDR